MVRSPRAFMKIAERAVANPPIRWQAAQSTFSRVKALSTRSPLSSCPAGPPMGPARKARPPSLAIATAALAAQPPLTTKKPLACTLPSGWGNSSTRNTSSKTMMPAQRIRGARSAEDIGTSLYVAANNMMGDRDRRRRGKPLRVLAVEHQGQFFPIEPARVFKFFTIDDDSGPQRLGIAADHDRRRERPRLRCEIAHPAARNSHFFRHLSPHCLFDRFAGFGETGKARPHAWREPTRATEHAALARNHQHDHDRIGTRKMLGTAGRTIAPPAAFGRRRRSAAVRAKAVPRMPTEKRLGLGERRQMVRRDHALHRDRAKIGDFKVIARFQSFKRMLIEAESEARRRVGQSEEDDFAHGVEIARFGRRKQCLTQFAGGFKRYELAADHIGSGLGVFAIAFERSFVAPNADSAVDLTGGVAERLPGAEIGTGRHDQAGRSSGRITRPLHARAADKSGHTVSAAAIVGRARPAWRRIARRNRPRRAPPAAGVRVRG